MWSRLISPTLAGGGGRVLGGVLGGVSREAIDHLPLCSFGPGGGYVVDWQVLEDDQAERRRVYPPRTLGRAIQRLVGFLTLDLKGWLIADHPGRAFRIDAHPLTLEPCAACGHQDLWPRWWIEGRAEPAWVTMPKGFERRVETPAFLTMGEGDGLGVETVEDEAVAHEVIAFKDEEVQVCGSVSAQVAAVEECTEANVASTAAALQAKTSEDDEAYWPYLFRNSKDLEAVTNLRQSSAGALLARLTGSGVVERLEPDRPVQTTENAHDPDPQTTQDSHRDSRLPSAQRLLANDAGTGRSARRVQGNHLRARRSTRTQEPDPAGPQQGTLFGDRSDGQAA